MIWFLLRVFCPASTDDELKDLELQKKIRQLKWVTRQHLDAAVDLESGKVQDLLEDAINGTNSYWLSCPKTIVQSVVKWN